MLLTVLVTITIVLLFYLLYELKKHKAELLILKKNNLSLIESFEKYTEIFNEQNVKDLLSSKEMNNEILANETIGIIKKEYKQKLKKSNESLTEEHEMLVDFITLTLSFLIKIPPTMRMKLIENNTDNHFIKKILFSKLSAISKFYVPVSILEIAISKDRV